MTKKILVLGGGFAEGGPALPTFWVSNSPVFCLVDLANDLSDQVAAN